MVPSSVGDAVDRLSILRIKAAHLPAGQQDHVQREIRELSKALEEHAPLRAQEDVVSTMYAKLFEVNKILWDIEDQLRLYERAGTFGDLFIQQARLVYKTNDQRAALKRALNDAVQSDLIEVKTYK